MDLTASILVIEDDEAYLENIKTLLEEEGFNVITVNNGFDGIESAKNSNPDLIICDIMLPDIDGHTILKELRRRERTKIIPFIFLTAKSTMRDLREGMNLGADDYITKPFRSEDLLTAIRTRLEKTKSIIDTVEKSNNSKTEKTKLTPDDHIFLPNKSNYEVVKLDNIVFIESDGVYSNVFCADGKKVFVRKLLKEWEEILPDTIFIRVHKSLLINIKYIKKVEKWFNGSLKLSMENYKEPLTVSRRFAAKLKKNI